LAPARSLSGCQGPPVEVTRAPMGHLKDMVLVASFIGGMLFGGMALFAPSAVGEVAPTWTVSQGCLPLVCDHDDLGASTGNYSACVDRLMQCG
jgi:hypothetical protein